ncbi:MAG: ROK family protein, partial [Kordiimonadaceae bacterium]|nr:ROK family protein [Kordiimonadaceae bacterium]
SIKSIAGRNLSKELESILSCPVYVGVDAACFTRVEVLKGKAQGKNYVFGLILGTGVGGSFFINGQVMKGRDGLAGEWGHGNNLHEKLKACGLKDHLCGCGQTSCLDSYGAGKGLERIHHQLHDVDINTKNILDAWRNSEAEACKSVEIFITLLVDQLTVNVNILNPEMMPVAGGLAKAADLIAEIDKRVRKNCIANYEEPLIVPGEFIIDGCLRGAALLIPAAN